MPDAMLNKIFDGRINIMYVMDLKYNVYYNNGDHASIIEGLLKRVNTLSSSSKYYNAKTSVLERLNIFSSVFENH